MANSVDPDETAHDEPFHLDIHCLHRYLFRSVRLKELRGIDTISREHLMQLVLFPSANVSLLEQILSCQIRPLFRRALMHFVANRNQKKKKKKKRKKKKKKKKKRKKKKKKKKKKKEKKKKEKKKKNNNKKTKTKKNCLLCKDCRSCKVFLVPLNDVSSPLK